MNKVKKFWKSENMLFLILFFVMLFITIFKQPYRDDLYFGDFSNITGIPRLSSFILWRFSNWTSRWLIEIVLVLCTRNFFGLWKIADSIVYVVLAYSISKVFLNETNKNKLLTSILVCFIILIPQAIFFTAGWVATSLNYLWPVAFGMFSIIPIKKCINQEKFKKLEYCMYISAILFASNAEQVALILTTVYFIFMVYFIKIKKIHPIIIILFLVSIVSLCVILFNPGNDQRNIVEIENFWISYEMLNAIDKLVISISLVMRYYIFKFNVIYVLFTFLMMKKIYQKYHDIFYRFIGTVPFLMGIMFNIFRDFTKWFFPDLLEVVQKMGSDRIYINFNNFDSISIYMPLILSILTIGFLLISMYLVFGKSKKGIIAFLVLSAGICSKLIIGFVCCTAYYSEERTQFVFLVSMIILLILLLENERKENLEKYRQYFIMISFLMILNNICLTLNIS